MANKKPTEPTPEILDTIAKGIKGILDGIKTIQGDQKTLSDNQKLLWEKLPEKLREETGCLFDQLIQATDRLDQIERTIYDDAWAHRSQGGK